MLPTGPLNPSSAVGGVAPVGSRSSAGRNESAKKDEEGGKK